MAPSKQEKKISFFGILFYPIRLLIKTAAWALSIAIVLAFIVPAFIPVEKIIPIPTINAVIQEKTGLTVNLNGKTRLSLLPFVGVVANNVQLTNEQFTNKEVLNAKKIDIKISVFPILTGKIIVKHINIDGADINIIKCKEKFNFFSPQISGTVSEVDAAKPEKSNDDTPSMLYIRDISLTNFAITNSNISYTECETKTTYNIEKFNAKISIPNFQSPVNADIDFILNGQSFDLTAKSSNISDILEKNEGEAYITLISDIANISASAKYKLNTKNPTFFDKASIELKVTDISPVNAMKYVSQENTLPTSIPNINLVTSAEITSNNIKLGKTDITAGDISITAKDIDINVMGSFAPETLSTSGLVTITASNIQNILNTFKVTAPNIAKYPSIITAPIHFSFEKGILKISEQSNISIDGKTTINFYAIIDTLSEQKSIAAKVDSKLINIDEYIKFKTEEQKLGAKESTSVKSKSDNILIDLPKESITLFDTRTMAIDFQVNIQKLIVKGLTIENINSIIKAKGGIITNGTSLDIFGGKIKADIKAQESNTTLKSIALDAFLQDVETSNIITTFNLPPVASGKVKANISFSANESNAYAIATNGSGKVEIGTTSLTIKGIDLDTIINDIKTDYKKLLTGGGFAKYLSVTKKSAIDQLFIQAVISGGVVKNNKFIAKKDKVSIDGSGEINMLNSKLQYSINFLNGQEPLPSVVLNGKLDDISYSIDPKAFIIYKTKQGIQNKILTKPEVRQTLDKFNNLIGSFKK